MAKRSKKSAPKSSKSVKRPSKAKTKPTKSAKPSKVVSRASLASLRAERKRAKATKAARQKTPKGRPAGKNPEHRAATWGIAFYPRDRRAIAKGASKTGLTNSQVVRLAIRLLIAAGCKLDKIAKVELANRKKTAERSAKSGYKAKGTAPGPKPKTKLARALRAQPAKLQSAKLTKPVKAKKSITSKTKTPTPRVARVPVRRVPKNSDDSASSIPRSFLKVEADAPEAWAGAPVTHEEAHSAAPVDEV